MNNSAPDSQQTPGSRKWLTVIPASDCVAILMWFVPFSLTPFGWFNHFLAFTSSVHFWWLFFFLAACFVFAAKQAELRIEGPRPSIAKLLRP